MIPIGKRYNTPHRSRVVKTRMTEEEYADFTERLKNYDMSQAEFIRQAITRATIRPIVTVSPVNDELLSAVGKLTAEYGKIGGNLNQIAHSLNEYGTPYLKSLKNGGKLQLDENIPYTAQMIATLTRQQVGTVERALGIFQQLGLVEQLHGGLLYMTDIELMIGQSSTEAERKRAARLANKALPPPRTNGGHLSDIRPPELEIKKEIDIEIEKEREEKQGQAPARSYGRYNNVFLSDTELSELKAELPDKWEYYIDRLSTHIASKGTKYRSHAATIYKWAQEDEARKPPKKGIPDYTFKEGESL